jgi:hypothetical protein
MQPAPRLLRPLFVLVDLGFVSYWLITLLHLIPAAWAFKDYENPILAAWNWSFLPLDLCVSATGLGSLRWLQRKNPAWSRLALLSLALTFCSGLQAIAFFALRHDFDPTWWLPNLFLLLYPLAYLPRFLRG